MKALIRGREIDTASVGEIRIEMLDVNFGALSDAALLELGRCFVSNGRKCKGRFVGAVKRELRGGIEQIATQLAAETERRLHCQHGPADSLTLVFGNVEKAACLVVFLTGLYEIYLQERSKIPKQGEMARSILDLKSTAFECAAFCKSVVAAINEYEIEV